MLRSNCSKTINCALAEWYDEILALMEPQTGSYADNPILNSIIYEVEFPDGQMKEYAANTIAENMLTQVDSDGYSTTLMQGIIEYRKDDATAVPKSDKWVITARGQRRLRMSTVGWKLLVQ
jgi:hypothetical protein